MLTYTRKITAEDVPTSLVQEVAAHVAAELSAMADPADDPDAHAADVQLTAYPDDNQPCTVLVQGTLYADADAPYLKPGYQAFADVPDHLLTEVYNDEQSGAAQ